MASCPDRNRHSFKGKMAIHDSGPKISLLTSVTQIFLLSPFPIRFCQHETYSSQIDPVGVPTKPIGYLWTFRIVQDIRDTSPPRFQNHRLVVLNGQTVRERI